MKTLPTKEELRDSFNDFSKFSFELLQDIEKNPHHLKFAAVNTQIALELFLKYYYVTTGKVSDIQKKKNGNSIPDFVDFSQILAHFYSSRRWSYGKKKELIRLLEIRNSIVHRGQKNGWDQKLAESIVRTLYFIHCTAWGELNETLFEHSYLPHPIRTNQVWRNGVKSVVEDLSKLYDHEARTCLECELKSVVTGDIMGLHDSSYEDNLVCLNCFTELTLFHDVELIECYNCKKHSYIIDPLNEQPDQLYSAKCTECETSTWVRKCKSCEQFYHPSQSAEEVSDGAYYCDSDCVE